MNVSFEDEGVVTEPQAGMMASLIEASLPRLQLPFLFSYSAAPQ
jgi:hypothetical protein